MQERDDAPATGQQVAPDAPPPAPAAPPTGPLYASGPLDPSRPTRPPVSAGGPPPRLAPPDPPASLRVAGLCWRLAAAGMGIALGLACLKLTRGRTRLRDLVIAQAPDASDRMVNLATSIVLFGGLILWALLAAYAVWVSGRVQQPRPVARLVAVLAWVVLLVTLIFTAVPLTDGHGLGLIARLSLAAAALAATGAVVLGVLPNAWRWIREVKDGSATRPGSGSPPAPEPLPPAG